VKVQVRLSGEQWIRLWEWLDLDKTDLMAAIAMALLGYGAYQVDPAFGWIVAGLVPLAIVFIGLFRS
jgi:hypothetical protein